MAKDRSNGSFFPYISFILTCIFSLSCEAVDDNPKLHIVYMGSLPETPSYSPTGHHLSMLQQVVDDTDSTNSLIHSYKRSFNGFAAMLSDQQKSKLSQMEGVISIFPSKTFQTLTTKSWDFIGFPQSAKINQTAESDIVIGVIDSGIWPESESFNDNGYRPIPQKWRGTCAGGTNFTCNKKIVGARYYVESSARDYVGHGSHTASIAAGNQVKNVSFYGLAQGTARGGVPSARIAVYKACTEVCLEVNILAAFDDAIADGVDIISLSLGFDEARDLDEDSLAIGSFHAMVKGIVSVQAAGNSGPYSSTVASVAPWVLTVASSTINRQFFAKVVLGNGKVLSGKSINTLTSNGTKFPLTSLYGDSRESKNGSITLSGSDEDFAYAKGAIGVIKEDTTGGYIPSVTIIPSVALHSHEYALVQSYKNSSKDPTVEILKCEMAEDHAAPYIAEFSSRGPNELFPEILKPDISAPGVEILAAYSPIASPSSNHDDTRSFKYNILSGTSMACPHVAGIAAYVKGLHLDWSPAAIKSAIMTSARPMNGTNLKDQIGEYAYGSGQVNPVQAAYPGLIYDIGKDDYIQMFCNLGFDNKTIKSISGENIHCSGIPDRSLVRNLNYPALATEIRSNTSFSLRFNRTVTNVGLANSTYKATILSIPQINITVAPEILTFKSVNEKQSFVVTITGGKLPNGTVIASSLTWLDGTHSVRSPVIVNVSS